MEGEHSDNGGETVKNPGLFIDEHGFRVGFYIHKSVKKAHQRTLLKQMIESHGGTVVDTEEGCDTVIVDPLFPSKTTLQIAYNASSNKRLRDIYVELPNFIQRCIQRGSFYHPVPQQKGMGGVAGPQRRAFTTEDDEKLIAYLAIVMPDKEAGGRLGLNVYSELIRMATLRKEYKWAERHTAESWKQRYKTQAAWMDAEIVKLAKVEKPTQKQRWYESRLASHAARKAEHLREEEEEDEDEDEDETAEEGEHDAFEVEGAERNGDQSEEEPSRNRKRRRSERQRPLEDVSPHAKRRRTRQTVQRNEPQLSDKARGKQRALEEGLDEPEEEGTSLFSQYSNEDGPISSPIQRQPELPSYRTGPPTPSFLTQETLVNNTWDDQLPGGSSGSGRPSTQGSPQKPPPGSPDPPPFIAQESPIPSPRNIPPPSRAAVNPPAAPYRRPVRAARRPRSPLRELRQDPEEAPYKNTRSRSRSMEPSIAVSLPIKSRRRKKRNDLAQREHDQAPLDTLNEAGEEVISPKIGMPVGETLNDELEVENDLITDNIGQNASENRQPSLETDDAQLDRFLRRGANRSHAQPFSSLNIRPTDVLKNYQASSILRARPSLPSQNIQHLYRPTPLLQDENTRVRYSDTRETRQTYASPMPTPRTPTRRNRGDSTSSSEQFPVPNTRASAVKRQWEQEEKRTPYRPPPGTKAAELAKSR